MELGLYTFAETTPSHEGASTPTTQQRRMCELVEEAELAEQVGLDVFGVGEHHRSDFIVSSPAVVLGAIAARTSRIRLTSAVTVLSSDDPVRVFQDFATLDLLSNGRAEIMAGRGSFVESFPLFGYDLEDYDALFAEKLDLLLRVREDAPVTWSGRLRAPLRNQVVMPRPVQHPLPVWIAVGGTPASAQRTGSLGLPMALAIIGGAPERFASFVEIYRDAARRAGHDVEHLPLSINGHGHIAESSEVAATEYYPGHDASMRKLGRERGWPAPTREQYDLLRSPRGALLVGDPKTVADKILFQYDIFRNTRYLIYLMGMPHQTVMRAIELYGTRVAPLVREGLRERGATDAASAGD
ncbi:MAG TPA: LLM class flavin-dependent oxidoreductase [Gemmatimonadaceae bacterium]|jgi:probable LLM family oxidoreductase|nr:LLM class flavin-dependent oxidoreductase [Gemmatimonadaceae bacterium]